MGDNLSSTVIAKKSRNEDPIANSTIQKSATDTRAPQIEIFNVLNKETPIKNPYKKKFDGMSFGKKTKDPLKFFF